MQCELSQMRAKKQVGASSEQANKFNWKAIWQCHCPGKMKQFLWRMAHNSLPHRWSIERRGMEIDTACPMCSRLNEDGGHLFLRCKAVRPVWRELQLEAEREKFLTCNGPKDFISAVLKLQEEKQLRCITMLWVWWDTRNKRMRESHNELQKLW